MKGDEGVEVAEKSTDLLLFLTAPRYRQHHFGNLVLVDLLRKCDVKRSSVQLLFGAWRLQAFVEVVGINVERLEQCEANVKRQLIIGFHNVGCADVANASHEDIAVLWIHRIIFGKSFP